MNANSFVCIFVAGKNTVSNSGASPIPLRLVSSYALNLLSLNENCQGAGHVIASFKFKVMKIATDSCEDQLLSYR